MNVWNEKKGKKLVCGFVFFSVFVSLWVCVSVGVMSLCNVCLFVWWFVCMRLCICLSVFACVCLYVCLYVCGCVCVSVTFYGKLGF